MTHSLLLKRLRRNIDDYGLIVTIKKAISFIFMPLGQFRRHLIYSIELNRGLPSVSSSSPFHFRLLTHADAHLIAQIEAMEEWLDGKVASKLANGNLCLVALDGDTVAGFNLISFRHICAPAIQLKRECQLDEAWSEQITVRKGYRNRGIATELRRRVFAELTGRGMARLSGATSADNRIGLKLARKAGFHDYRLVYYIRLLWFKKWIYRKIDLDDRF
jgi:GNAT superfamily N-acetyltransferase